MAPAASFETTPPSHRLDSAVIDALSVAVYVCDRDGRVIRWNPRAAALWGREPSPDDRYTGALRVFSTDESVLPHHERPMVKALRTGEAVREQEIGIERPDGSRLTVCMSIVPLTDAAHDVVGALATFYDITAHKPVEADLRDFVEQASEGLHWLGPNGTILWANQAELDLLGYTRDEYVGHNIAEFHVDPAVADDILSRKKRGDTLRNYEASLRRKDGTIRHVLINANVLFREQRFVHTRCFTRDITDRKRAEQRLQDMARHKDEFVLTLAHELRQPLAPIVTALELLKRGEPRESSSRPLDVLERQVGQMLRLVDDLLDTAHVASGKIELRRQRIDLRDIVKRATEVVAPLAAQNRQHLAVSEPRETIPVDADPHRIQQVLSNLLTNAVKFTPRGGQIALTVERRDQSVELRVRDNGHGIAPDHLADIFDLFAQASPEDNPGFGVGLSVVRRLVEAHDGTVEARSAGPGQGSEFIVRMPLAPNDR